MFLYSMKLYTEIDEFMLFRHKLEKFSFVRPLTTSKFFWSHSIFGYMSE